MSERRSERMTPGGRIGPAVVKEFRQFFREPMILVLVLWLYTVEIVLCAVSLSFDLDQESMAVLDRDHSSASVRLADTFDRAEAFRVTNVPASQEEAAALLDAGEALIVLVIPQGYAEDLAGRGKPRVQLLVDGTNAMMAQTALGLAELLLIGERGRTSIAFSIGTTAAVDRDPTSGARAPDVESTAPPAPTANTTRVAGARIENRVRIWYNPGLRSVYFVVLSMIALAAFMVGVIHPAATIVKEKESGTIEQVLVSPLRTGELLIAKTLPTLVVGLVALGPSLLVARAFGVPFRGDLPTFLLLSAVFLMSAIGTGVLIATWTRTLQQALLVAFFILFPILFLSGTMTPIESMPAPLQALSRLSPLRYYMEAILAIFLKGVGLDMLWRHLLWMFGLGTTLLALSVVIFRQRLAAP